jgi:tRNA-specific 2-thiouridylase
VGSYGKQQIRGLAKELNLRVADKKDSQDICFVPSGKYDQWVRARRGDVDTSGEFINRDGAVVGKHQGIERFTIGQRKGLGVALGEPRFVVRIDADSRRVVIGARSELARQELTANRANWLVDSPRFPRRCLAQIRYNSPATPATVEPLGAERLRVVFDEPCYGIAPGQAVVCYAAERVLGGGWIE